ncbi:MAG: hypothetical protein ACHQ1H_09840 [Nitrososphaerales archaeon]
MVADVGVEPTMLVAVAYETTLRPPQRPAIKLIDVGISAESVRWLQMDRLRGNHRGHMSV